MSEYQYYEFLAIDRPLDDEEQAEVREVSTRATITDTRFVNVYHWGDFRGDPVLLMNNYYDAHLHVTNWGTHEVMFRLPCDLLDPDVVEDYLVGGVSSWVYDEFVVLDFVSDDLTGEFAADDEAESLLEELLGVRAELATGDLRPLYLAWLAAYGVWERDEYAFDRDADNNLEPPVPPGLGTLTAAQQALADFLHLDEDLLATAAQTSPPVEETTQAPSALANWVTGLPEADKDRLLTRVVQGETAGVRAELQRRFRDDTSHTAPPRRTVGQLLDEAARRRTGTEAAG
ncbi:hypothetical protein ABT324_13930 [Saccharopolyspora sp. NPDC000359]|uniref:hypothetical protein n=1 Tax=Saccharopolyspora sp. NPDC000359 TaxID=3154251 RepID=UPI00331AF4E0